MPVAHGALDPRAAAVELEETFLALRRQGRNDAAYCVAHAGIQLLGDLAPESTREYALIYRPPRPRRAATPLDDATWVKLLYHPDDDLYVGKVFEAVLAPLRRARAQPVAKFGLRPRDAIAPGTSSVALVRALGTAAFALNVPPPLIFARPAQPGSLTHIPSDPIATVAGADALTGRALEDLAFLAGHHMTFYRPDHYALVLYDSLPELTTLFLAVLVLGGAEIEVPAAAARTARELEQVVRDAPATRALVRRVVQLFVARGDAVDIHRWARGVQLTAARAGLLLSADLTAARRCLPQLGNVPDDAMADLMAFAMSDAYFTLRLSSGIALWPDEQPVTPHAPSTAPPAAAQSSSVMPPAMAAVFTFDVPRDHSAISSVEIPIEELSGSWNVASLAHEAVAAPAPAVTRKRSDEGAWEDTTNRDRPPAVSALEITVRDLVTSGATDRAYAVARVWASKRPEEVPADLLEFLETHRWTRHIGAAARPLGRWDWSNDVRDPAEDTPVGRLVEALGGPTYRARARTPEDYGFDPAYALTPDVPIAAAFVRAAHAFGVEPPTVFMVDDLPGATARPPCTPHVTFVQPTFWCALDATELAFAAAEHVAWFRPDRIARVVAPTAESLAVLAQAAAQFLRGETPDALDDPFVRTALDALGQDALATAAARTALDEMPDPRGLDVDVFTWCRAAERTAARAALVTVFDLRVAASVLRRDRGAPQTLPPEAIMAALESFASSAAFTRIRTALGF